MTLKEAFKTAEGIVVLSSLLLIILTGIKVFAYLGLIGYTIVNLERGIERIKGVAKLVTKFLKNLLKKGQE